jgi:prepilin-type N-terminal cleavage/methylation domain-containing protein
VRTFSRQDGFSVLELIAALGIIGIIAVAAVPATTRTLSDLRLRGDARNVHNAVALAKMRAAAHYTRERLYVDRTTNSFHIEFWDKDASPAGWADEKDPTVYLQTGVSFGYGNLTTPPDDTQSTLQQAPACKTDSGTDISGTSCIVFNSRGIPLDGSGNITGNSALYITDGTGTYGVTLSATPLIRLWWTKATAAEWIQR